MFRNIGKNIKSFLKPFIDVDVFVEELNLIYVSISKTGISSIRAMILDKLNIEYNERKYDTIHKKTEKHFKYIGIKELLNSSAFKYSMVRNPFDRLVSCYKNKIKEEDYKPIQKGYGPLFYKNMSFDRFVKRVALLPDSLSDRHIRSQYSYLYANGKLVADYIGRFEEFDKSVKVLQKKLSLGEIKHINSSEDKKDYRDFYTEELAEIVYKRYKKDIEAFGYDKDFIDLLDYIKNKDKRR
jgi:hypothetical protein